MADLKNIRENAKRIAKESKGVKNKKDDDKSNKKAHSKDNKKTKQSKSVFGPAYPFLSKFFPGIERNIELLDLHQSPKEYIFSSTRKALIQSTAILVLTAIGFYMYKVNLIYLILMEPIYFLFMLYYNNAYLKILVAKRQRSIDYEIIYLLRYVIVSAKSGMSLYDSLAHISNKYGEAGKTIGKVVRLTALGKTLSQALVDVAKKTPSIYMERVLVQLSNSLSSGADISDSISSLLKQINDEEMIKLKSYGRQLTPFTMFYMIFGIIAPSIGVVLSVVMLSIMGGSSIKIDGSVLALIVVILTVVQYLFLGVIKQGRPKYII